MRMLKVLLAAGAVLFAGCYSNPHYSPVKKHHTRDGFRNNYAHPPKGSFWKWQWDRWVKGVPANPKEGYGFELVVPDADFLRNNRSEPMLTWIGHATFLLQVDGVNILTDPHCTQRASPLTFAGPTRHVPPALALDQLPHIDVVLISHSHYDHLDLGTLRGLAAQPGGAPLIMAGLGLKDWFARKGLDSTVELDWWDTHRHAGIDLHFVPVQHWSARTPWDRNRTLWGGWVIEQASHRYFFGGDFGYSRDLADIGERFGRIDLAMLPIGAYEPRWFMSVMHVNPEEAVQAHFDLNARRSVGMHWGTFRLTDERLDEPPQRLAAARAQAGLAEEQFFLMKHGETRNLVEILAVDDEDTAQRRAVAR
jgi:N-acyl-phosphatidylethanolamine-hydrolysing phospholipase D